MTDSLLRAPEILATVDGYRISWTEARIEATAEWVEQKGRELTCELTVRSTRPMSEGLLLAPAAFNLSAPQTRKNLARQLAERDGELDWDGMIEQLVVGVRERYRAGEPTVDMRFYSDDDASVWHLEPFIGTEGPTVLFGDGGMGKSTLALAMLATTAGAPILGKVHATGPAMFLDYEGTKRGFHRRLTAICEGAMESVPEVHYRREYASLTEAAPAIRREIDRLHVRTVVVDPVGLACGGSPEAADVTLAFFRALDSLRVPALVVDHITKHGGADQTKAYGSVYKHNRPRLAWRLVSKQDGAGRRLLALTEHKHNDFAEIPPLAYRMTVSTDARGRWTAVEFEPTDVRTEPELADLVLKGRARLRAALLRGGLSAEELAEETGRPVASIERSLRRYRGHGFVEKDGVWWNQEN